MATPLVPPDQELRDLLARAVALEYLRAKQNSPDQKADGEKKPLWLQLFESAGFAALITVLVGGIAGAVITGMLQQYGKQRDAQTAAGRLEHDRKVSAYNQHLDRERKLVDEIYFKLGKFVDGSRDLTILSRKEFCEDCPGQHLPPHTIKVKLGVIERYDAATIEWNSNRLRLGMLLQLEHENDKYLLDYWKKTSESAEQYAECADRWRSKYKQLEIHEALQACAPSRGRLDEAVQALTNRLVELRRPGGDVRWTDGKWRQSIPSPIRRLT